MTYIFDGFDPTTASTDNQDKRESWLLDQVTKSEFFHQKLHEYGLLEIAYAIESIQELEAHHNDIDYWLTIEDVLNRDEARQELFKQLGI